MYESSNMHVVPTSFGLIRDVSMKMPYCVDCMEYALSCVLLLNTGTVHTEVINAKHFRDELNVIKRTEILSLVMSHVTDEK